MAPWPMAAGVTCNRISLAGSAAAGLSEFLGRRAFIPVAFALFVLLVCFTAGAGMQGSSIGRVVGFFCIAGCGFCLFWHLFTNRTGAVRYLLICA